VFEIIPTGISESVSKRLEIIQKNLENTGKKLPKHLEKDPTKKNLKIGKNI